MRSARPAVVAALLAAVGWVGVSAVYGQEVDRDPSSAAEETDEPPSCGTLQKNLKDGGLEKWLRAEGEVMESVLSAPETHRAQVLVREVRRREGAPDCLLRRGFRVDAEYVYPASAIKTVAAVEALRYLERWNAVGRSPRLGLDSVLWYRRPVDFENLEETGYDWTRGGRLRKIVDRTLVVSSNEAFNRLFDLVGHEQLNRDMWEAGLESVRLRHRMFSKRTVDEQKWSPKVAVETGEDGSGGSGRETIRPERTSELDLPEAPVGGLEVGDRHTSFITGEFRDEPMDFSDKNYISLEDLQRLMVALYRPELIEDAAFSDLVAHRAFLAETLGSHPEADSEAQREELVRRFSPMLPGVEEVLDGGRVDYRNKAGRAYGFHLDNARIVDRESGAEVFVTAAVYVNENRELNDNDYEYDEKSYPFLRGVGRAVAKHLLGDET